MPPTVLYPLINGFLYSFRSIELRANNLPVPIFGIKSINYSSKMVKGRVYGSRPQMLGRTRGKVEDTGDVEMLRGAFEQLKLGLAPLGVGFGEIQFDWVVQYAELGSPVITDTLIATTIDEANLANTEGDDPSMVKLTLNPFRNLLNGSSIALPIGIV